MLQHGIRIAKRLRDFYFLAGLDSGERRLVERIKSERLTYLSTQKLVGLLQVCHRTVHESIPGIFIEAGCALGGSTILMARARDRGRGLRVYDVFGMIPPPTEQDTPDVHDRYRQIASGTSQGIGGDTYYGYRDDLYETVVRNMSRFGIDVANDNVQLVKGLLQDTLQVDVPVAVAHIDVDWYEPVLTCLERISPRLSVGGCFILDDYAAWGGCRKATDEFLHRFPGVYARHASGGALRLTRLKG